MDESFTLDQMQSLTPETCHLHSNDIRFMTVPTAGMRTPADGQSIVMLDADTDTPLFKASAEDRVSVYLTEHPGVVELLPATMDQRYEYVAHRAASPGSFPGTRTNARRLMTNTTEVVDVAVVRLGYVSLPTTAVLARAGLDVVGVDRIRGRVKAANRGDLPFLEEGLTTALAEQIEAGHLHAQMETPSTRAYIIAAPTPSMGSDRVADLSLVETVTKQIAPRLTGEELIILEPTRPPSTTCALAEATDSMCPDLPTDGSGTQPQVHLSYCPERVLLGRIITEMVANSRIIGGLIPEAPHLARSLYVTSCAGELILTDATTAKMTKLMENSFRGLNIAFVNGLVLACEQVGVDVWEFADLVNRRPQVSIPQPGPGVGGHCIATDPWFLVPSVPEETRLTRATRQVDGFRPTRYIRHVLEAMGLFSSPVMTVLGLTSKTDVDDLCQSPALVITKQVATAASYAQVLVAGPYAKESPASLTRWGNTRLTGWRQAVEQADAVAVLIGHQEFTDLDPHLLEGRSIIDATGFWRARKLQLTDRRTWAAGA